MKTEWKKARVCYSAALLHSSGLLKIVKYRNCEECYKRKVDAIFAAYYRNSVKDMFGWHVERDTPFYVTLNEAKQAAEKWLKQRSK